jgi:basic membrane lipoprotein Med (substrate-binding protein (PBP1-ABC) superfamily)
MKRKSFLVAVSSALTSIAWPLGAAAQAKDSTAKLLKVAVVFPGPAEEPWNNAIYQPLLKAKEAGKISVDLADNVGYPEFERVLREFSSRGYNLIVGDAFGSDDKLRRVAKQYPQVNFLFGSALPPQAPNVGVFNSWIEETTYLTGVLAALMTKTGTIGIVSSFPQPGPNRKVNAFMLGAKSTNPATKVKVTFLNSWYDPAKAKEATFAQVESGADFVFAERFGVVEACKEKGVYAFGNIQDQRSLAPKTVVTSVIWDLQPLLSYVVGDLINGTFQPIDYREWSMMAKGGTYLTPFQDFKMPADKLVAFQRTMQAVKGGETKVPLNAGVPTGD